MVTGGGANEKCRPFGIEVRRHASSPHDELTARRVEPGDLLEVKWKARQHLLGSRGAWVGSRRFRVVDLLQHRGTVLTRDSPGFR